MRNLIKKIVNFMCFIPRKIYYSRKKKRLKNQNFTIISRDCFGTFVYHNLGLQYKTPTVNLFFSKEDFITFVSNLKEFLNVPQYLELKNLLQINMLLNLQALI